MCGLIPIALLCNSSVAKELNKKRCLCVMVKKARNVKNDINLKTAADVLQKSHCYDPFFAVVLQILAAVETRWKISIYCICN